MEMIELTPKEAAVLNHRLEVPDCIAEVWGPDNDNVWGIPDIEDVGEAVSALIEQTFVDKPNGGMLIIFDPEDVDQRRLLDEVIDGNAMRLIVSDLLEYAPGEDNRNAGEAWRRAMRSLDKKFEAAGLETTFGL